MPRFPLPEFLRPAWIDEGRALVQAHAFRRVLAGVPFGGRCLNAGCGEGLYAGFLESFAGLREIVHLDLHTPRFAARLRDGRHRALRGSVTALPFAAAAFDAVLCSEVIEHVADDRQAVGELARVLRPGGWLLLSVPTPPAPFDPAHVREGYTLDGLRRLLEDHGFAVRAHAWTLHGVMRLAYAVWQWQFVAVGRRRRSLFPRGLIWMLAAMDRTLPVGKPWDLVVLAERRGL